jgi:hypothetical protein
MWNTYSPLGVNRIVKFPELYEICISVFLPDLNIYTSKFYHLEHFSEGGNVLRVYEHSPDFEYAKVELVYSGFVFRVEYASKNSELFCRITPLCVSDPYTLILIELRKPWDLEGDVELVDKNFFSFYSSEKGKNFYVKVSQDFHSIYTPGEPTTFGIYSKEEEIIEDLRKLKKLNEKIGNNKIAVSGFLGRLPLKFFAGENILKNPGIGEKIDRAKINYLKKSPKIKGGQFNNTLPILQDAISWCVVYDKLNNRPYTPINRSWIDNYMIKIGIDKSCQGPLIGLWDNLFNALIHSISSQELAESNVISVLDDNALIDGVYPPNYIVSKFRSGDRSQPPIGSLVCWKIYCRFKNKNFLKWTYPRLKEWHLWWKEKRDGNSDGLLEWGSNIGLKEEGNDAGTLFAAKCESGMDNSPLYDDAEYIRETMTMNLTDIGLNSMFCADSFYLSKIAEVLEIEEDKNFFEKEYEFLKEKINRELWNEEIKSYQDKYWNNKFSPHLSPTSFYPLFAKIPDKKRAEEIVKLHLLNPEEFWGEYVIPSISKREKSYNEQIYWRGRIWPSMNYLVYLGLKEYDFDKISYEFAKKNFSLFMKEWEQNAHSHENYNAITGLGCDVPIKEKPYSDGSDRFYSWGLLLLLSALEELIDVELTEGIRFGCIYFDEKCSISNLKILNSLYDLEISKNQTIARRNNKIFFKAKPGVQVRNYVFSPEIIKFRVKGNGITKIEIYEFKKDEKIKIEIEKIEKEIIKVDRENKLSFEIFLEQEYYKDVVLYKLP